MPTFFSGVLRICFLTPLFTWIWDVVDSSKLHPGITETVMGVFTFIIISFTNITLLRLFMCSFSVWKLIYSAPVGRLNCNSQKQHSWPVATLSLSLCSGMAAIVMSWPSPTSDGPALVSQRFQVENIVHFAVWVGLPWVALIPFFCGFKLQVSCVFCTKSLMLFIIIFLIFWTEI